MRGLLPGTMCVVDHNAHEWLGIE